MERKDPPGLIQMLIAPDGRVVAHVADFQRSRYGGFSLLESQRVRCRDRLAGAVREAFASPQLTQAIDSYDARGIVDNLVNRHGYRTQEIVIGHETKGEE